MFRSSLCYTCKAIKYQKCNYKGNLKVVKKEKVEIPLNAMLEGLTYFSLSLLEHF